MFALQSVKRRVALALAAALAATGLTFVQPAEQAEASALYAFTTHTFDTCSKVGHLGPSLADCQTSYSSTSWRNDSNLFSVASGVQQWKIPATGTYRITVVGAHGAASTGASNTRGGRSAVITADRQMSAGDIAYILVGQAGSANTSNGGGGGASFFNLNSRTATTDLIVAGGGGGTRTGASGNGGDASTEQGGRSPNPHDSANPSFEGNTGTVDGYVGQSNALHPVSVGYGGLGAANNYGDGGAGWFGAGLDDGTSSTRAQKLSGTAVGGGTASTGDAGGFGGGGSGRGASGGGGGGGYTGGSGAWVAGGGGSFAANTFTSITRAIDTSRSFNRSGTAQHGYVTITLLAGEPDSLIVTDTAPFTTGSFVGDTWVTSTRDGVARVDVSTVLSQLVSGNVILRARSGFVSIQTPVTNNTSGRTLTLDAITDAGISSSGAISLGSNSNISIRAGRNVTLEAGASLTAPGNITLNSDSDQNGAGQITVAAGATVSSTNGNLVLSGGANPVSGVAVGSRGVDVQGATLSAANGTLTIRGRSSLTSGSNGFGVNLESSTISANTVNLTGARTGTPQASSSNHHGVQVKQSSITHGAGGLTVNGNASAGSSSANNSVGVLIQGSTLSGTVGNVTIVGIGANTTGGFNHGVDLSDTEISASGQLKIEGQSFASADTRNAAVKIGAGLSLGCDFSLYEIKAQRSGTAQLGLWAEPFAIGCDSSQGNVHILADAISASADLSIPIDTAGSVTIEGLASSTGLDLSTAAFSVSDRPSGIIIGNPAKSGEMYVASPLKTQGNVLVYGSEIFVSSHVTSSGQILLKSSGGVFLPSGAELETSGGDIVLWSSTGGSVGAIGLDGTRIESNGGNIVLGGGSDANSDGKPDGFARPQNMTLSQKGAVNLMNSTVVDSGGGNISIRGEASGDFTGVSGVFLSGQVELDAGSGKVLVEGRSDTGSRSDVFGIRLDPDNFFGWSPVSIRSDNVAADAVVLSASVAVSPVQIGPSTLPKGSAIGARSSDWSDIAEYLLEISSSGGIQIFGSEVNNGARGLELPSMRLSAVGDVLLLGSSPNEDGIDLFAIRSTKPTNRFSEITAGGSLTIRANSMDIADVELNVAGDVVIEPTGTSFVADGPLEALSGNLKTAVNNLRIGKPGNLASISISQVVTASQNILLFGGSIGSNFDMSGNGLAIGATGTITLNGQSDFSTVEMATTKASPTAADILFDNTRDYVVGNLSADVTGAYGVPTELEFIFLPTTTLEFASFEIAARVGKDAYGIPLQANNRTPSTFNIAKSSGNDTLAGATAASVLGPDVHTFSDLVMSDVPGQGSSISFTIAESGLTSTTSGLLAFLNSPSSDATLSGLSVGTGSLLPSFVSGTLDYSVTVQNTTTTSTITPTANNADYQSISLVYFGGSETVTSGQASTAISLTVGRNTIAIVVTAEDGTTETYTIVVFRQLAEQVDWDYGNVSITSQDGSVSTKSNFVDLFGANRVSSLQDSNVVDEDGLPRKTITIKVGETLHLPMVANYGNSLGYGGIVGPETHICGITSFTRSIDSRNAAYNIRGLRAGSCDGVFISTYERSQSVMLSLGSRAITDGSGYFRTPYVDIIVERKDQLLAGLFLGSSSTSSTVVWNTPVQVELKSTDAPGPLGAKSYQVLSGPCSVATLPFVFNSVSFFQLATGLVQATGPGTCVVQATQEQDSTYNAHTATHTIVFTKATQQLSFTSNVPAEPTVGSSYSPVATSSAALPVTLGITAGNGTVCNLSGGEVSFIATGSCTIQATQAGDASFLAATPITQTLIVGEANQNITFTQISDKEVGDIAFRAVANATSGLAVSFTTVSSNTICTVSGAGLVTIVGEGVCSVTANQSGNALVSAAQSVTREFNILPEGSSAPFITAVSFGDGSITATLIAPSYTGGLSILDFSIFAYDANNQNVAIVTGCDAATTPIQCSVTGLNNGQPYTLKAAARTAKGLGNLSAASKAITPLANPQAVRNLTALAGDQTLTVTWKQPADLGGGDFSRYDIRLRPSGGNFPGLSSPSTTISSISQTSYEFTGLQNGVSYDVEVITITTEPASAMSAATLESSTAIVLQVPFTKPNAPRNLAAFAVDDSVKIAFAYPDFDGGRAVSEYRVSVNGTVVCTPTQVQVCSVPMSTFTSMLSSNFVGGIGFQNGFGSQQSFLSTTTQVPISVVAENDGGTSVPATTTFDIVSGSSTPISSGAESQPVAANLPTITSYSKQVLQSTGDAFSISGSRFNLITEIWLANTKLSFVRLSDASIRISTPLLPVGSHNLQLRGAFGVLNAQDILSVIEGKVVTEGTRITRAFVDGFVDRSTYMGPRNTSKLKSFVLDVAPGSVVKCYGSIPTKAKLADIRLAFKRADRVCDYVQSLNPNIELVRTWVWKDGDEAWERAQVRLTLFQD